MNAPVDVLDIVSRLRMAEEPFVLATVVRTISVTAAKAGAKAVIRPDGRIEAGWIGGGCARGATLRAAREALVDGQPRLISIQPENLLDELGVHAGDSRDGVSFARNMCPSKGTMDILVEPVLPRPILLVLGSSPVALALVEQARPLGYHVTLAAPIAEFGARLETDAFVDGFETAISSRARRFVVISTQGKGDEAALKAALGIEADYRCFVGSRRKMAALRENLAGLGFTAETLDAIKAPAGLDLGAITPEEIALSILAEITQIRRAGQRMAVTGRETSGSIRL